MKTKVSLDAVYAPSKKIVAREINGELIIIPIYSGIADMEDELFSLNETGKIIWNKLDGKRTLEGVADELFKEFDVSKAELEKDALGLIKELVKRRMLVERK